RTSAARSSSPRAPRPGAETTGPPARHTTTSNAATLRPQPPNRPSAPTRSSSPTGSNENQPEGGQPLDDFIRRVDHPADLGRERQERGELLPVRPPQLHDGRVTAFPGGGERLQRRGRGVLVGRGVDG